TPNYVVSERIANEYMLANDRMPHIQPPFISLEMLDRIDTLKKEEIEIIKNNRRTLDRKKLIIGMCGSICNRKNYKLFIEVSKYYSDIEFLWIGGDDSTVFDNYINCFHIKTTINPYKYFVLIDYFILFSEQDPCPYV